MEDLTRQIKERILAEFLPNFPAENLTNSTPLISGGILDSVKVLQLVSILEETFGITIEAHEVNTENLDTILDMANFIATKQNSN